MDISSYLRSDHFKILLKELSQNAKFETLEKIKSNFTALASDAFNEGVMSIMAFNKTKMTKGPLEKSNGITEMLPDHFVGDEMGQQVVNGILNAINSYQKDGQLNIGYESLLKTDIENFIRIVYAIGISSGFEIANDEDYKSLYLSNRDRFLMHGAEKVNNTKKQTKSNRK